MSLNTLKILGLVNWLCAVMWRTVPLCDVTTMLLLRSVVYTILPRGVQSASPNSSFSWVVIVNRWPPSLLWTNNWWHLKQPINNLSLNTDSIETAWWSKLNRSLVKLNKYWADVTWRVSDTVELLKQNCTHECVVNNSWLTLYRLCINSNIELVNSLFYIYLKYISCASNKSGTIPAGVFLYTF